MHGLHRILELGLTNGSPKTENERMRVGFDTEIVVVGGGIAGFFAQIVGQCAQLFTSFDIARE